MTMWRRLRPGTRLVFKSLGILLGLPFAALLFLCGWHWIEREWPADLYRNSPGAECRLVTTASRKQKVEKIYALCGRADEDRKVYTFWSYPVKEEFPQDLFLKTGTFRPVTAQEFRGLIGEKYWLAGLGEFPNYHQAKLRIRLEGDMFRIEQEYDRDEWRWSTNSAYTTDGRDIAWLKRDYYDRNCFSYRVLDRDRVSGKGI